MKKLLLLILLIQLLVGLYQIEQRTSFGWDQERDAQIIWQMIKEGKPTLIGPRALSPDSFFLGPLWFYLLAPFYFVFNLNPLGSAVFGVVVGLITSLAFFIVGRALFTEKVGLIAAFLYLPAGGLVVWNPMLIPLFSLILIYLFSKILDQQKYIPLTMLIIGLSLQVHFQAIFFLVPFIICLCLFFKKYKKLSVKHLLLGSFLFAATFLPLIIFDLRHDFLNTQGFFNLFLKSQSSHNFFEHFFEGILKYISSLSNPVFNLKSLNLVNGTIVLLLSILGILTCNLKKKVKYLLLSFLAVAPLLFSLYSGNLSEYYFTIVSSVVILSFSTVMLRIYYLTLGKIFSAGLIILILFTKVEAFNSSFVGTNLYYQKQAVSFMVNQKIDPIFNVSYSVPKNADAGFRYLFKYYEREPQDIDEGHLWTIFIPPSSAEVSPEVVFGDIAVVRR